jgi:hypothetical protein
MRTPKHPTALLRSPTLTTAIAIYGAVLATLASLLEVIRWRADRPRLQVVPTLQVRMTGCALLIEVTNHGRPAITLREIGFEGQSPVRMTVEGKPGTREGKPAIKLAHGLRLLESGEAVTVGYDVGLEGFPDLIHVDDPIRPYAHDTRGRRTWGPAAPLLARAFDSGWKPPKRPRDWQVKNRGTVPIKGVYPRWHLWRSLGVRDPLIELERKWWIARAQRRRD